MARVSYLQPAGATQRSALRAHRRLTAVPKRSRRGRFFVGGFLILVLALAGAAAIVLSSASASLSSDGVALARIGMPLGGGSVKSVSVTTGHDGSLIPVELRGDQIWPKRLIPAHETLQVVVVIKRPGWVSWLAGKTQRLHLTLMAPSSSLVEHNLTLKPRAHVLPLKFKSPIRVFAFGPDPVSAAKVVAQYAKDNEKFSIVGGFMGETVLNEAGVKSLATLPSLDQIRAQLIGLIQAPATKVAGVLQAPAAQLARVLNAYATKDAA